MQTTNLGMRQFMFWLTKDLDTFHLVWVRAYSREAAVKAVKGRYSMMIDNVQEMPSWLEPRASKRKDGTIETMDTIETHESLALA